MKTRSRTYNVVSNSLFGIGAAAIGVALNFLVRIFIVRGLGEEVNGLHNLFQSTINVLALMETGIGLAMIIHLYEPVKNEDKTLITQLVGYYKKIYFGIALAFLLLGILVDVLVLDHIVTTSIPMWEVKTYFLLFILASSCNYLTFYKKSVLFAEQKNRVSILANVCSQLLFRGLSIVFILLYHQYFIVLVLLILEYLCSNCICIKYVNKHHPYLKHCRAKLSNEKKKSIFNTIKPLFVNQIASTVQNSSNSILISMLLGNVAIVGYYGSYQLVVATITILFSQMGGAFTSSFGNLAAGKNKDSMFLAYRKAAFVMYFVAFVCSSIYLGCIQDFIEIIFGKNFVLASSTVLIIVGSMVIYLLNIPIMSVQNAMGLHRLDDKWMVVQTIAAILLGYLLGKLYGMNGILVGVILPNILFSLGYKGIVISKYAFSQSQTTYLKFILLQAIKGCLICAAVVFILKWIAFENIWLDLVAKGCMSFVLSLFLAFVLYRKDEDMAYMINIIKKRFL